MAGLVSVHDRTWTTDRATAAQRWSTIAADTSDDLDTLLRWSNDEQAAIQPAVDEILKGLVATVIDSFTATIGLWT